MNFKKVLLPALLLVLASVSYGQYIPPNIDFETGTLADWQYFRGTVATGGIYTLTGCSPVPGLHTLTAGTDTDYYGGFPIVGDGHYSLKLGHDTAAWNTDRAQYNIHVPVGPGSYNLLYRFAVVLEDPIHAPSQEPRMEIKAIDSATGLAVGCDSFCFVASTSLYGFKLSTQPSRLGSGYDVMYMPWTAASLNLSGVEGHTINIIFTVAGCSLGAHFGYGYVDMSYGLFATQILSCGSPVDTLSGPAGYSSYQWLDTTTSWTPIDTTPNIIIPTPGIPTTYAVIVTPYPGYGCTDTLYTQVTPLVPCSGMPAPGCAYAWRASVCGAPDTLTVTGYSAMCGLLFQWQYSYDNATWTDVFGATSVVSQAFYDPYKAVYYRCAVTCTNSGLTAFTSSVFIPATIGSGLYTVVNPPDTICNGADFYVSVCGVSTFNVTTYYGDGTSDNNPLTTVGIAHADIIHHYPFPGTYSVKQILYDSSLPVDSDAFSFQYLYCSTLPVKFYFDNNYDCVFDKGDTRLFTPVMTEVDSNGIPVDTISSMSGFYYQAYGSPGTIYSFRVVSMPSTFVMACPSSGILYDTILPFVNLYPIQYMGIRCTSGGGTDLAVHAVIPSTGGGDQYGTIYVQNNSTCDTIPATVTLYFSPQYVFTGNSAPLPSYVSGNSLIWNLTGLSSKPVELWYAVYDNPLTDILPLGDTVYSYFTITPFIGDIDTTNNTQTILDTSRGGSDPNFILVSPPGCLPSDSSATNLQYTISFENTGNDTAFNIHIMDTLPNNVDARSLKLVAASAQMDIASFNISGQNIVKFDFPGINLLDSSHHGQCDGMVMFNINTLPGLPDGTVIFNHAGIFFDTNPVVLTNIVENVIGCEMLKVAPVSNSHNVALFPNPATDELTIKMDAGAYNSFTITNEIGQELMQQPLGALQTRVNIKTLPAGMYYITFKGDNGTTVQKFVKM